MANVTRHRVLFLCTGNSCRSQMAEAVVNARGANEWQAFSAGTEPAGFIHPKALQALAELDIRHSGYSKNAKVFRDETFDVVITVCDSAAENCPVWLGEGYKLHLEFPDPAKAQGSDEEVMSVFRQVLADIAEQVPALLEKAKAAI